MQCKHISSQSIANSATTLYPSTATLGVEMFKKSMESGQAGDNVGLLLRGLKRDDLMRGQVICKPNTVKTAKKFEVGAWSS
jgi:elongation factor Tu